MKFTYIKEVDGPVISYGGIEVSTGDVVEFDGPFAMKAQANTAEYRLLTEEKDGAAAVGDTEAQDYAQHGIPEGLDELRAAWQAKFGKKPHHKKSADTLRQELKDGD